MFLRFSTSFIMSNVLFLKPLSKLRVNVETFGDKHFRNNSNEIAFFWFPASSRLDFLTCLNYRLWVRKTPCYLSLHFRCCWWPKHKFRSNFAHRLPQLRGLSWLLLRSQVKTSLLSVRLTLALVMYLRTRVWYENTAVGVPSPLPTSPPPPPSCIPSYHFQRRHIFDVKVCP